MQTIDFKDGPGMFTPEDGETVRWYLKDGAWRILLKKEKWTAWSNTNNKCANCIVDLAGESAAGPDDVSYGMLLRYQDKENYYSISLSENGKYSFGKNVGGKWSNLISWTASPAIKAGKNNTNLLRVVAVGNNMAIYVNGQALATVTDDSIQEGVVGMIASSYAEAGFEAGFRKIQIWQAR
jgi:hypothetical protein